MVTFTSSFSAYLLRKATVCAVAVALAFPVNYSAHAASHALTAVANVNVIDYVVNVDWDFDNPPTQVNKPDQVLDRAYITSVIREAALSVFTMTEGRHRLGTITVYRNKQFGNNVSIQLINTNGRSKANIAGFGVRNSTSFNHLSFEGTFESQRKLGRVIAHELGHYTYGLFDEYVDAGTPLNPNDPGAPSQSDNAKNTFMNDQNTFPSLSTPADYANPAQRQTAQARVFATSRDLGGGSAWETLTRTPDQDPESARGLGRTFFEAFRGINPATLQLTRPEAGFDQSLNMVFAPNPQFRDVIVVDRTLAPNRFAEVIQAAKALVGQAQADTQLAIVVSPAVSGPVTATSTVLGYTDSSAAGKQALGAALESLQPTPQGAVGATGAFDGVAALLKAYSLVVAVRQPGDMATLHLLTGAETSLPVEVANAARQARVSINALGMTGGAAQAQPQATAGRAVGLAQLSKMTGGSYNRASTGAEAAKDVVRAVNETHAAVYAGLSTDGSGPLDARNAFNSRFVVASGATDGVVTASLFFDPQDAAKLKFSLIAPNGTVYTASNATAGIEFVVEPVYGEAVFVIGKTTAARAGFWTVRAEASAQTVEGVGLEVSSDSLTALTGEVLGGLLGDTVPITLRAKLGAEKSIKGAVVTADVYNAEGRLVLESVALKDDGAAPDARVGDGQYTVSLAGRLPPGEYTAIFAAATNAGSRIAPLGALRKGAPDEELPVEIIGRTAEVGFALEAGARGVLAAVTPVPGPTPAPTPTPIPTPAPAPVAPVAPVVDSGGGSGCSMNPLGNDAGLALLLLAALAGAAMRRRQLPRASDSQKARYTA